MSLIQGSFISLTIFMANKASSLGKKLGIAATGIITANNGLGLYEKLLGSYSFSCSYLFN